MSFTVNPHLKATSYQKRFFAAEPPEPYYHSLEDRVAKLAARFNAVDAGLTKLNLIAASGAASSSSPKSFLVIDGSCGEGGGQILRSSISLACILRKNLRIINIRAKRSTPGLGAQHCVCALAAAKLSGAKPEGVSPGSREMSLTFSETSSDSPPEESFEFDIGSAGSTALVYQTLFPILVFQDCFSSSEEQHEQRKYQLKILGGTHNGLSPSLDFLGRTFLPALHSCVPMLDVGEIAVERIGFYPAGGGRVSATIKQFQPPRATLDVKKKGEDQEMEMGNEEPTTKQHVDEITRVCDLTDVTSSSTTMKLKSYDVKLLHTRAAEQGNKNTISVSAVADAVAAIKAKFAAPAPVIAAASSSSAPTAVAPPPQSTETKQQEKATPSIVPPANVTGTEIRQSLGRGWMILQEIVFAPPTATKSKKKDEGESTSSSSGTSSQQPERTMILASMERNLVPMMDNAAKQAAAYFSSLEKNNKMIFVDEYLCDQLLLPLALYSVVYRNKNVDNNKGSQRKGFVFQAACLSLHSATNIVTIEEFLGRGIFTVRKITQTATVELINCGEIYAAEDPKVKLPPASMPVEIEILAP